MMYALLIVLLAVVECAAVSFILLRLLRKNIRVAQESATEIQTAVASLQERSNRLETYRSELVSIDLVKEKVAVFFGRSDVLRAERGRCTIAQVELESVKEHLQELEEIERELEVSEQEIKEELKILQEREQELREKNEELRQKLEESRQLLEQLLSGDAFSKESEEKLRGIQAEIERVVEQSEAVLNQIAEANEQYYKLKRSYDALDIEYAQLYEKCHSAD